MSENNGYIECDDLNFTDLEPIKIRVPIGNKKYILHEALGPDLANLANKRFAMMKYDDNGKILSLGSIANLDLDLVQFCMYVADENNNLRMIRQDDGTEIPDTKYRVSMPTVRSWTGKVQQKLLAKIKEISDIDQETEEQLVAQIKVLQKKLDMKKKERNPLKNVSESTITTSDELPENDAVSKGLSEFGGRTPIG